MEWTEDQIAQLRALWDQDLPTAEIGRRMGITKCAVGGKAHRLELSRRPSPIVRRSTPKPPPEKKPRRQVTTLQALASLASMATEAPRPVERRRSEMSCQFPLNDRRPWRFCEAVTQAGSPYCEKHHRICYTRVLPWGMAA